MNLTEIFAKQIAAGANEKAFFFYGIEAVNSGEEVVQIKTHKGPLDTFPNLIYVSHMPGDLPLFRN